MDPAQEQKLRKIFDLFDADKSGYLDLRELRAVIDKMGVQLDNQNLAFLTRRYDDDGNGRLNFDEFAEMIMCVMDAKKIFEAADSDRSGTISPSEIGTAIKGLGLSVSQQYVTPIIQFFDETGTGNLSIQEFLGLVFYFQELEFQYEAFKGKVTDYSWLTPLLGQENQAAISSVAQQLQKMKAGPRLPTFAEFEDVIIRAALSASKDPTGRRKKHDPMIVMTRRKNKVKPPKKQGMDRVGQTSKKLNQSLLAEHRDRPSVQIVGSCFADTTFEPHNQLLPMSSHGKVFQWKRPMEIAPKAQLFVDGCDEGDVIQGGLGDCWFLGALAVVSASIGNHFIEHLFTKMDPSKGHYQCRFYKDGKWHLVDIDDRLPCGHSGRLSYASCRDPSEFWVAIIEKAYAKLHGSFHAIEMGNIADAMKDLTGEAVEIMLLDDPSFKDRKATLWNSLVNYVKESYLMGAACEDSHAPAEHNKGNGLLYNHAYSVIDCQEYKGNKLMRIRNPWGKGEWTGRWADGTKEWTPDALRHFEYEFGDDGTFFMLYDDFITNFNRIYVLRLMCDDEGEVWSKFTFKGEWKGATAGGCTNNSTWNQNPQYGLTVSRPNTKVFLNLSQPDIRFECKKSPANHPRKYDPIGVVVLKGEQPHSYKKSSFLPAERIATSLFSPMRDLSFEFVAQPGINYFLIPCTFASKIERKFDLIVYTEFPGTCVEISGDLPKKMVKGCWQGRTAGGCVNHRASWMNNPQFLLQVNRPGKVLLTLEQELNPTIQPECLGLYVFKVNNPRRLDQCGQLVVTPATFLNTATVSETLNADPNALYIVMPTTFDPLERNFTLTAASGETTVTNLALL